MDPIRLGRSIRALRHRRGWRQVDLAEACGSSKSAVSRVELGRLRGISAGALAAIAEALDAELVVQLRWNGEELDRLVDSAHADLVEQTIRRLRSLGWETRSEVTFNVRGERGSVDILAWWPAGRVLLIVEIKSRVPDLQAMHATLDRKTRLGPIFARELGWNARAVGRLLVIGDSRTARRRVADHAATFDAVLPTRGPAVDRWLSSPSATGRFGGLLFMPSSRQAGRKRQVRGSGGSAAAGQRQP
jgi:transcriptional regulator with XRE-family HTH domain